MSLWPLIGNMIAEHACVLRWPREVRLSVALENSSKLKNSAKTHKTKPKLSWIRKKEKEKMQQKLIKNLLKKSTRDMFLQRQYVMEQLQNW